MIFHEKKSPAYKWDIFTAAVYIWGAKEDDFFGEIFKVETETLKYSEFFYYGKFCKKIR